MIPFNSASIRLCLKAVLLIFAAPAVLCAAPKAVQPNILLVAVDDMADWISGLAGAGYSPAHTPNLDRLMKRGITFTEAYCVAPVCGPSRAAVLTGLRPETSKVYGNVGTYLDRIPQAVTFPEYLRQHGYRVMGAGKINHLLTEPYKQKWDAYGPGSGIVGSPFTRDELLQANFKPTSRVRRPGWQLTLPLNGIHAFDRVGNEYSSWDWGPVPVSDDEMPDGQVTNWALAQLSQTFDRPFLLAVGIYKPHLPWFAPTRYFELNPLSRIKRPPTIERDLDDLSQTGKDYANLIMTAGAHESVLTTDQWEKAIQGYLACISFADAMVGKLLDALEKSPYSSNTMVILWSDHGFHLGEKQRWGKHAPWIRNTRIPFLVVPPADALARNPALAGTRCDAFVSLLDLYPTLVEVCGLPPKSGLEGRSFAHLLRNPGASGPEAVVTSIGRGTNSIRYRKWHYIHYFDGTEELYNLESDPNEWHNLARNDRHRDIKDLCRKHITVDPAIRQYVRYKRWKAVLYRSGAVDLFDLYADRGISEERSVAEQNPGVVAEIERQLARSDSRDDRYVLLAEK